MDIDDEDSVPIQEDGPAGTLGRMAHQRLRSAGRCLRPPWSGDGCLRARGAGPFQCLKWRIPVVTIAIPADSATAATSASRTDPPG